MKTIDVKNQPRLGFARTVQISINGIRYRLFRSAVTMAVIAVAIAFLMNVLCEAVSVRAVGRKAREVTAGQQLADRWAVRLAGGCSAESVLEDAAAGADDADQRAELRTFGGFSQAEGKQLETRALEAKSLLAFLDRAGFARRRTLVGDAQGLAVFDHLATPAGLKQFRDAMKHLKTMRVPLADPELERFLADWPAVMKLVRQVQAGRNRAAAAVAAPLQGRPMLEALAGADGAFGETVAAAGYSSFAAPVRRAVAAQARDAVLAHALEEAGMQPELRKSLAAYLNVLPKDVNAGVMWTLLQKPAAAAWFETRLREARAAVHADGAVTAETLLRIAALKRERQDWGEALRLTMESGGGVLGIGSRMGWLVLVSLMVCAVGISNAMLMSVTERFREIATLKCLGALDGFIMVLFLLEAGMLGLAGGLIGALAGSMIGFGRMAATFGGMLFTAFPAGAWLVALLLAVVAGVILAAVAAVYPSYLAARLAPMEAMRIE